MADHLLFLSQVLLTLHPVDEAPLRFGFPLPPAALERGLRVRGAAGARVAWRALQTRPDPDSGRVWVELAVTGGRRGAALHLVAGGRDADVVRLESAEATEGGRRETVTRWTWHTGRVDEVRRVCFLERQSFPPAATTDSAAPDAEEFAAGESLTLGDRPGRFTGAGIAPRAWREVGVLPPGGALGRGYRRRLLEVVPRLVEGRGRRDRGDYRRSGDVVTNLEFDTALAFARLGLAEARPELLVRAWRSALHSADHDLDPRSGLLFRHGRDHRAGPPDPGHTWLAGILLVGCLAADEHLVNTARLIARGLSRRPANGKGRHDRVRDLGWPLQEMEAWLRFEDDREVAVAAAEMVRGIVERWDATNGVVRCGEGEVRGGLYDAPAWVTAGSLLPGLRAYLRRTGDRGVQDVIRGTERRLARLCRSGKPGIPVRYLCRDGLVIKETRIGGTPSGFMLLEGLELADLRRVLGRQQIGAALRDVPAFEDPDLATSFTIAARCWWVYR